MMWPGEESMWYMYFVLDMFFLLIYTSVIVMQFISIVTILCNYHKKSEFSMVEECPGVSIVKPLMGLDPLLEENLESHFRMTYPKFELLCCFPDDQDPAINLVERMKEKYPHVDCTIFTGGKDGIINPMVFNMAPGYDNAKYDYVWISTSRIKAHTDYITDMAMKLQKPNVALVHQMPFTADVKGIGAAVEKIYFGGAMARFYPGFSTCGQVCCTGMSYMFKKPLLDELNGLTYYGRYLAEDFFLTTALHQKGYKLVLSSFPAQQNIAGTTVTAFKDRMVRWTRLRLNMMTIVTGLLEPMSDTVPQVLFTSCAVQHLFGIPGWYFAVFHVIWMISFDYILLKLVQNGPLPFSRIRYVYCWIIREFISPWVFLESFWRPHTIIWGKREYHVSLGGSTKLVTDKLND